MYYKTYAGVNGPAACGYKNFGDSPGPYYLESISRNLQCHRPRSQSEVLCHQIPLYKTTFSYHSPRADKINHYESIYKPTGSLMVSLRPTSDRAASFMAIPIYVVTERERGRMIVDSQTHTTGSEFLFALPYFEHLISSCMSVITVPSLRFRMTVALAPRSISSPRVLYCWILV